MAADLARRGRFRGIEEGEFSGEADAGLPEHLPELAAAENADAARAQRLLARAGESVWPIGTVRRRRGTEAQTQVSG
jgi:hypothetical protein